MSASQADDRRTCLAALFGFYTGQSVFLPVVEWRHVCLDHGTLVVPAKAVRRIGGYDVLVPLHKDLLRALREEHRYRLARSSPRAGDLIVGPEGEESLRSVAASVGIELKHSSMDATFRALLEGVGLPLPVMNGLLGGSHAGRLYVAPTIEEMREWVDRMPSLLSWRDLARTR